MRTFDWMKAQAWRGFSTADAKPRLVAARNFLTACGSRLMKSSLAAKPKPSSGTL